MTTCGSGSLSMMVPVALPSLIVAPDAPERVTVNVSSPSVRVSPSNSMLTVLLDSPGAKVDVDFLDVIAVADGLLARKDSYLDGLAFQQQMGATS